MPDDARVSLLADGVRRQRGLALRVAATFAAVLLALPLLNALAPGLMGARVGGFTLTWLLLGVAFLPFAAGLALWFVRASDAIEADVVRAYREAGE